VGTEEDQDRIVDLTNEDVADILALLDSLPYDSLDLETPRFRLRLRRAPGGGWTEESQVLAEPVVVTSAPNGAARRDGTPTVPTAAAGAAGATGAAGAAAAEGANGANGAGEASGMGGSGGTGGASGPQPAASVTGDTGDADGLVVVAAPLPGTFYRAPRPGAEPFIQVGDEVAADTVVAIIETMKLMNSVHAGTAGRVTRVCVDNGDFAPLGTALMLIEPAP
jgi:acetyl-CoA carboxylase biotin carboxyl carrier protein